MKIHPIYKRYKSIFFAAILCVILLISGCAGGGSEIGNPAPAESGGALLMPSISNLVYSSESGASVSGDSASDTTDSETRAITISGSVDFVDEDGNVSFLIIDIIDADNNQVEQITQPIEESTGQISGTVEFTIDIDVKPGDYIFEVYIMDESDNESDFLTGTFSVTD